MTLTTTMMMMMVTDGDDDDDGHWPNIMKMLYFDNKIQQIQIGKS